jgi:hypothetical protein
MSLPKPLNVITIIIIIIVIIINTANLLKIPDRLR